MKFKDTLILGIIIFVLMLIAIPAIAIRISELALFALLLVVLFNIGKPR